MEEAMEQSKNKIVAFCKKWAWLFALAMGVLAIVSLCGTVVNYEVRTYLEDGTKVKTFFDVHLWDYFANGNPMNWTMWLTLGLIVIGVCFTGLSLVLKGFATASSLAYLVAACLLFLAREFFSGNADAIENYHDASIGYGAALGIIFLAIGAVFALIFDYSKNEFSVRDMAEDGILIALAFGLNFVKIPVGASGGSANLQMLPLMLIALRHGPVHGFISGGLIFGLLTCLTDGYGFATYPFDYLIAFGSVAVMGFFSKYVLVPGQKGYALKGEAFLLLGGILATFIRFVGSTTSSMVIYGYDFGAACAYNAVYIPVSGAIAIALLMAIYGPLCRLNTMFPPRQN